MINKKNVLKIQCPFERIKKYNSTPETALYKAVIMQMIIDASNISQNPKARRNELKAKAWLFSDNKDFRTICLMSNMHPETIRQIAKALISVHHKQIRINKEKIVKLQTSRSKTFKTTNSIL